MMMQIVDQYAQQPIDFTNHISPCVLGNKKRVGNYDSITYAAMRLKKQKFTYSPASKVKQQYHTAHSPPRYSQLIR